MGPSLVAVNMAAVVLEGFLYGIFLVLFVTNLYIRTTRYARPQQFNSRGALWWNPIVISTLAIFATCTAHWILTIQVFFQAFLNATDPTATLLFYMDNGRPIQVARHSLTSITLLIGDALIIHRLWLIWNREFRVVALPVLTWLGVLVCGIFVGYGISESSVGNDKFLASAGEWLTANWVLSVFTNVYCTGVMAWRIWTSSREMGNIDGGLSVSMLVVLVESAAIWTAWAIFFAVAHQAGSSVTSLATDLTGPIIGLVNMLIHLRVGLGWSHTLKASTAATANGMAMTSSASMFAVNIPTVSEECDLENVSTPARTIDKREA
ncbi:hypothetical protein FB451DRAFT_1280438 [Mycena latifolia]|nr:hypothetical protein FB451DRAFT_1280438 [Mycena latifolia]